MGFIDCEGEKERIKGKNKKVTGSKINRSLPDFIGITTTFRTGEDVGTQILVYKWQIFGRTFNPLFTY